MKAILEFNMDDPSDRLEHKRAIAATDAYIALTEIANQVFRPARKHGYSDPVIKTMIERCGEQESADLIDKLEDRFYEILKERGINLADLE